MIQVTVEVPDDKVEFFLQLLDELKCVISYRLVEKEQEGSGTDKKQISDS